MFINWKLPDECVACRLRSELLPVIILCTESWNHCGVLDSEVALVFALSDIQYTCSIRGYLWTFESVSVQNGGCTE